MYRSIQVRPAAGRKNVATVIAVHQPVKNQAKVQLPAGYKDLDRQLEGLLSRTIARGEFSATRGSVATAYPSQDDRRVYILGLGKPDAADGVYELGEALRVGGSRLLKMAFNAKIQSLDVQLAPAVGDADAALVGRALGDGLAIANFEFETYKGSAGKKAASKDNKNAAPGTLQVAMDKAYSVELTKAIKTGQSVNLARRLAATPPNVANPAYLVSFCRKMATQAGLKCTVIDHKQAQKLGMGGLLAVGGSGSTPPAIITLEHKPARTAANSRPVLLVGKAVTFDTGGYSLKPADSMPGMKYDKCGGMAVIGAMHAIASLKLPVHVVGVIPTAENMVSDKAYRPADIIRFCNGVTSEITNTDAEGRLILADALAHGTKAWQPQAVIDLATLTGGVVVALGGHMAGLFCNSDALRDQLMTAGRFAGERLWQLPLWEEHRQQMKGNHGDLINSANREASPIQGAAFLSYFVGSDGPSSLPATPWAHLDIAGVADTKAEKGPFPVGPTGFGVRLLVRALENWQRVK